MTRRDWLRILDANLNRAREAVRVVEDALRLGSPARPAAAAAARALRHRIGGLGEALGVSEAERLEARDSRGDPGAAAASATASAPTCGLQPTAYSLPSTDPLPRNLARATEALRTIEEAARALGLEPAPAADARFAAYALERDARLPAGRRESLASARLCVILDAATARHPLPALAATVAGAGAKFLQLRTKSGPDRERLALARAVVAAARPHGTLVIVNDRADLALAAEADGVHVGDDDLPADVARRIVGPDLLVGATAHDMAEAAMAVHAGADYLGYGTIFPTALKPERAPCGPGPAAAAAGAFPIPVFAIGGITAETLPACLAAGVSRVAVSRAVGAAADPAAVVRALLHQLV